MLEGVSFVDCMVIEFAVAPDLSSLQVVTEVQQQSTIDQPARMGHVKIRLASIEEVEVKVLPGFHSDLDYAYGYKGNEIYEFSFETIPEDRLVVTFRADLLSFQVTCPKAGCRYAILS